MNDRVLIDGLSAPFEADFADRFAREVSEAGALKTLYGVVTASQEAMTPGMRHRVAFRGAYVLERIYFADRTAFGPFVGRFCRMDFPACSDASARRHFGKIMADLLRRDVPEAEWLEPIAAAAAEWAFEPGAKVAVKVWAMEILKLCRGKVEWIDGVWEDMMEALARESTPGIACRLRKNWRCRPEE